MPEKPNIPPLPMHLYTCIRCAADFALEDHEDVNHSDIVCPICQGEDIEDAGWGMFYFMQLPDPEDGG
ncbi:hypothetical protein [Paenibacillus sp. SI8]|uniref:hypothetical protein n=1 Tax=unclassified Paenibacillus TaxID=185978 RepID=UPI003465F350